jgi:hypothetical protein
MGGYCHSYVLDRPDSLAPFDSTRTEWKTRPTILLILLVPFVAAGYELDASGSE